MLIQFSTSGGWLLHPQSKDASNRDERDLYNISRVGKMGNEYGILVGNSEGKRPLERRRRRGDMLEWILKRLGGFGLYAWGSG
jgi:hypothetical protein